MRLKNKVAIITGSGRGIGRAIAVSFAAKGVKVIINDIDEKMLKKHALILLKLDKRQIIL